MDLSEGMFAERNVRNCLVMSSPVLLTSPNFKACKIVNFNPKHLKLRNRVFHRYISKICEKKVRFIGTLRVGSVYENGLHPKHSLTKLR